MSKRLLVIVDDEEDLLDLFEYFFRNQGFEVEVFNRAKPALDFIAKKVPDMILCDWMMPEMSGIEMCRTLKKSGKYTEVPFVMVTCRNELSAKREAIDAGAAEFISKPFRMNFLLEKIQQFLPGGLS